MHHAQTRNDKFNPLGIWNLLNIKHKIYPNNMFFFMIGKRKKGNVNL